MWHGLTISAHFGDAQTKESLTLRASSFGSKCDVSDTKFLKKLEVCGISDLVSAFATFKNEKELKKTDGAKRSRITGLNKATCLVSTLLCGFLHHIAAQRVVTASNWSLAQYVQHGLQGA